ncbi:MAG TPA: TrkH family potassium uptake protein [Candidatus Omnitrophota bacterium]|nr:TrkH family potassium uptake protein [Candidatus Omnitrophota bacterium]HPD84574.1 TrkH family potassium uptake protein [Candidatus Omnitrophota bacterium]HRZ03432.1 TrkH family potassium uptake protein [Candidatus Omnitrophota bacterium]
MILRPQFSDFKVIGFYLSKLVIGVALFMVLPMAVAFLAKELNPLYDFFISFLACLILGSILYIVCYTKEEARWSHGMVVVSLAWALAAILGALPLFLSGHFNSFLDAVFEAMSGFTTSGLTLAQDLGHMSYAHNFWRHLMMFLGGQGIVVIVLAYFVRGATGAFRLYVGEGRDERLLPDIRQTARFIWMVSAVYLVLGTLTLGIILFFEGMPFLKSIFHGVCIFMTGFDTGGFAPQQQNVMYYHSLAFEIGTLMVMLLGAINFKLHYVLWTGNRKEIWRNIETRTLFFAIMFAFVLVALGLSKMHVYPTALALFRKGFYHLISAQTGTGFQVVYSDQFVNEWNGLSLAGLILAMSLGGCICSTTGAIKMLRIGIITKTFISDVKRHISPALTVLIEKMHHIKDSILTDAQMRSACLVTIAYIVVYVTGAVIGMLYGYPFVESLFESTSAAANVGLSCGITNPGMPDGLKIVYIVQMWAGRLEFMSVFVLIGFVVALIKGK